MRLGGPLSRLRSRSSRPRTGRTAPSARSAVSSFAAGVPSPRLVVLQPGAEAELSPQLLHFGRRGVGDERDDDALGAGAARSTGAVDVVLGVGRRVVVHDTAHV